MRNNIDTDASVQHQYLDIRSVVLSFGEEAIERQSNTLLLRVMSTVDDWGKALRVWPIYIGAHGEKIVILPCVWFEVWNGITKSRDQVLAELSDASTTRTALNLDGIAFVTQLEVVEGAIPLNGIGPVNALHVLENLNELGWMLCTGFRPTWYSDELHAEVFDAAATCSPADDAMEAISQLFVGPAFQRRLGADQLLQRLGKIPEGTGGATAFHDWVVDALTHIFKDDLERVRKHPNGNAVERRDIVATNVHRNRFWRRLYVEYKVSMPVF